MMNTKVLIVFFLMVSSLLLCSPAYATVTFSFDPITNIATLYLNGLEVDSINLNDLPEDGVVLEIDTLLMQTAPAGSFVPYPEAEVSAAQFMGELEKLLQGGLPNATLSAARAEGCPDCAEAPETTETIRPMGKAERFMRWASGKIISINPSRWAPSIPPGVNTGGGIRGGISDIGIESVDACPELPIGTLIPMGAVLLAGALWLRRRQNTKS